MNSNGHGRLPDLLKQHEPHLLAEWVQEQKGHLRGGGRAEEELRAQCAAFLGGLREATQGGITDVAGPRWEAVREVLAEVSRSRSHEGATPSETATFVFSLKRPLFAMLRRELARNPEELATETWAATELLDSLGLYTAEVYQ